MGAMASKRAGTWRLPFRRVPLTAANLQSAKQPDLPPTPRDPPPTCLTTTNSPYIDLQMFETAVTIAPANSNGRSADPLSCASSSFAIQAHCSPNDHPVGTSDPPSTRQRCPQRPTP